MEKMKNMIVLKNIKSNLVEEAIVVFKENAKIKQKQLLINSKEINKKEFSSEHYIKEAQAIIADYIKELENNKENNLLKIKLKALKILNIFLVATIVCILIFLF